MTFVEEVHALLHPEKVATITTQDHDGVSLRERINRCQEMPCCDGEYAECQQSTQQKYRTGQEAPFVIHEQIGLGRRPERERSG